jgi:hypothetical protein
MIERSAAASSSPSRDQPGGAVVQFRRWGPVVAGAALWWTLYRWNLQFWDWMIYDVVGLC